MHPGAIQLKIWVMTPSKTRKQPEKFSRNWRLYPPSSWEHRLKGTLLCPSPAAILCPTPWQILFLTTVLSQCNQQPAHKGYAPSSSCCPVLIAWQLPCFTPASPRIISCLLALRCEQMQMEFLWNSLEQQWLSKHWHTGYPSAVLPLVRAPAACAQGSCHWPCRTCCLTTKLNQLNSSMQPSCPSISEPIDLNI